MTAIIVAYFAGDHQQLPRRLLNNRGTWLTLQREREIAVQVTQDRHNRATVVHPHRCTPAIIRSGSPAQMESGDLAAYPVTSFHPR